MARAKNWDMAMILASLRNTVRRQLMYNMCSVFVVNIYQTYHRLFVDGVDAIDVDAELDLGRTICNRQQQQPSSTSYQ